MSFRAKCFEFPEEKDGVKTEQSIVSEQTSVKGTLMANLRPQKHLGCLAMNESTGLKNSLCHK